MEDVEYRRVDGTPLLARLYRPERADPVALIVDVHGGAWTSGDRLNNAAIDAFLAAQGCAVLALDFRMAPAARFPAAVQDVNFGIRWARANAARLGLRPGAFGLLGTSSGGHIALLNALQPDRFRPVGAPEATAAVDFVLACWPIADPLARYRMAQARQLRTLTDAHAAFWRSEAEMAEGSPQRVLEDAVAEALPPLLMLQGDADENTEHHRADLFADLYRRRGGSAELIKVAGAPHAFITKDPTAPDSVAGLEALARFVTQTRKEAAHGEDPTHRIGHR